MVSIMAERLPCDLDKELSLFLRKQMTENGWSYAQLEVKTGVKRSMLHNLVNLQRGATLRLTSRIKNNLKVTYADIFPESLGKSKSP